MKSLIKSLDYLSYQITLFYRGESRHKSFASGILTLIVYFLILACTIYFLLDIVKKIPSPIYFVTFVDDAGIYPMKSSGFSSYLEVQLIQNGNYQILDSEEAKKYVRFKLSYLTTNLSDYWLYDQCTKEDFGKLYDIKTISPKISDLTGKFCIKYFYNGEDDKIYKENDKDFRYPEIQHGMSNPNYTCVTIKSEKCNPDDETQINLFGDCETDPEKIYYFSMNSVISFVFTDNDIDPLNYNDPYSKKFNTVSDMITKDSYTTNGLNYNPTLVKTHKGLIIDYVVSEKSYKFEQNKKTTTSSPNTTVFNYFNIFFQNIQQTYERNYKKLPETLGNIGGMANAILTFFTFINYIINFYADFKDYEMDIMSYKTKKDSQLNSNVSIINNSKLKDNNLLHKLSKRVLNKVIVTHPIQPKTPVGRRISKRDFLTISKAAPKNNSSIDVNHSSSLINSSDQPQNIKEYNEYGNISSNLPSFMTITNVEINEAKRHFRKVGLLNLIGFYFCWCESYRKSSINLYIRHIEELHRAAISEEALNDAHYILINLPSLLK